jgi:hypothetical protein
VSSLRNGGDGTTLDLQFDEPISAAAADEVERDLLAGSASEVLIPELARVACGDKLSLSDSNGSITFGYQCPAGTRDSTTSWGYRISAAVQGIIVGSVSEDGIWWWRSDAKQPKQAPHVVPADYQFHGTFKPVYIGSKIRYSDQFTFRHNVNGGARRPDHHRWRVRAALRWNRYER